MEQSEAGNRDFVEEAERLTETEELFCQHYAKCLNGRVAYQEAIESGCTNETAASQASRLRRKQAVKDRISQLIEERKQRLELDGNCVLHELMTLGFSDLSSLMNDEGEIDPIKFKNAPPEVRRCVESVETSYDKDGQRKTKFKLASKLRALELLGKNPALKLFVDNTETKHEGSINFQINFVKPDDKRPK